MWALSVVISGKVPTRNKLIRGLNFASLMILFCYNGDVTALYIARVAVDSFPFPGGDRTIERKAGEQRSSPGSSPGVRKKIGEKWGGGEQEGVGEKRNRLQSIPNILLNCVRLRTGSNSAIWLVISPSIKIWHYKFVFHAEHDIRNTTRSK